MKFGLQSAERKIKSHTSLVMIINKINYAKIWFAFPKLNGATL
jgi:hypothetical protein